MLLAVDIGNTNIVFGLFQENKLVSTWRSETSHKKSIKEYSREINEVLVSSSVKPEEIKSIIVSSVVPEMDGIISELFLDLFSVEAKFVNADLIKDLKVLVKNKDEVGADRLVNALAAYKLYGGPAVIVDFGTATTFCAVTEKGEYLGGAIAPGIGMARDSLHEKTAKLPKIDIDFPEKAIGGDTVEAMRSGLFFGYLALVEGMIKRFKEELGKEAKVIATGGFAGMLQKKIKIFDAVNQNLTLEGLRMVWEAKGD